MTTEYTSHFNLPMPDFRTAPWSDLVNGAIDQIDKAMYSIMLAGQIDVWATATAYTPGTLRFDAVLSTIWLCTTSHTSGVGTFAADRAAHPSYWTGLSFGINPRGVWQNATAYGYYDFAYDNVLGVSGICIIPHTSNASGTIRDDAANWAFLVDLPSIGVTPAVQVSYDNTASEMTADNVQDAIDENSTRLDNAASVVSGIDTDLTTLEGTVSGHTTTIGGHTTTLASHTTTIADHESRIDALEAITASVPSTTKMLFWQAAAPTGWTKDTTHNDKALRVVSGTGGGNGGSVAFSTVFGKTATDATTITTSTMPSHTHGYNDSGASIGSTTNNGTQSDAVAVRTITNADTARTTGSNGSGGSHTHGMDIRVQYIDLIIATKD
jgi:hypothetical protein